MNIKKQIEYAIQKDIEEFWEWAQKFYSREQIVHGNADSPSFPNWNRVEHNLEKAFNQLEFETLEEKHLDNIIFLIAQQWDIGIILNWFNKGNEEVSQIGMTQKQLQILSNRGLKLKLPDAKSQFAASLYKIDNKSVAIELLLKYYNDEDEYVRRCSLRSLHKLAYNEINPLLLKTWKENSEHGRMMCLQIWSEINEDYFNKYSRVAQKDKREYLSKYAQRLVKEKSTMARNDKRISKLG
ncbi:hypothetical protein [Lewinella sp. 4G2]|uniref:hypothetical protein n=1 Tax=Lewinella sp. 4G2 TaxID=1803372 RepID=UPI0007B47814|nr:hypothetical protein [Lewinella sp. 4G2]OAV45098.1 hypothetical protein A3850_011630 [Lewinella sp. 4G2]